MEKKKETPKSKTPKKTDEQQVKEYMSRLVHPLYQEIEALRNIIKSAHEGINERIKWNAPSYYYKKEDMVTFNPRDQKQVHLIFHHPAIEQIKSPILIGDYKGRRMSYFANMAEVKEKQHEVVKVIMELIRHINQ